nr:zinc-finger domain-containing protein [Staphylococcus epidermidis]
MKAILTNTEQQAIQHIDQLMNIYCHQCPLKKHNRKTHGKTQAHHFCINECNGR